MDNLYSQKVINANDLFDDHYLDAKALYLHHFNKLPDLSFMGSIDGEKALAALRKKFGDRIVQLYQYQVYDSRKKTYQFDTTMALMDNRCLIEFYRGYCEIWHDGDQKEFVTALTALVSPFRERQRRQPLEINLVVQSKNGLQLKPKEIKRTKLDLPLFYGEAFLETDELIRSRLNKKKDKGIVLLHGLPGAGKTTYLRYLIGRIKKKVLFLSPSVAGNLMNPDLLDLLMKNPDTVLIIEDAEDIIMDRKHNSGSSVSTLLNISDGLLADSLNIQLICTFNNSLTLIDSALLRKGRLIAKHEFGKLNITQSQLLSDHFGFDKVITKPMTVAEIANPNEKQQMSDQERVIGFRREPMEN